MAGETDKTPSSRRAVLDQDGNEIVQPGCFTKRVVACPCVITWVSFAVAVFACMVGYTGVTIKATAGAANSLP
jgi:hypothetical protein